MATFLKGESCAGVTAVDNRFITQYMPQANGEYVKVYLYGLMHIYDESETDSPFSDDEISAAFNYWQSMGIVRVISGDPLTVEYLGIGEKAVGFPPKYKTLIEKLLALEGIRPLTGQELSSVYECREVYGLDEDCTVLLVRHCFERYGSKLKPFQIKREAAFWADNSVVTTEDAAALMERMAGFHRGAQAVLKRMNQTRSATEDEIDLYIKWHDVWKLDEQAILDACSKLTSAVKPSFAYLDRILGEYKENGTVTAEDIREMEQRRAEAREFARLLLERAGVSKQPDAAQREDAFNWLNKCRIEPELMFFAADCAKTKNHPYAAMKKYINSWYERKISTLPAAKADYDEEQNRSERAAASGKMRAGTRHVRTYSDSDLKEIGVDLLD